MKWFPADSSGMLIPENTSRPPPPAARNAAAGYNWLQDEVREDERLRKEKVKDGRDASEGRWYLVLIWLSCPPDLASRRKKKL